ncbi:hypothetical protein HanPSC8_Chr13g0559631 [Helianthus annuus]|nr:hypothetical protein HanPSC8_Chr13g0559631 [Helianthus annuus]
MVVWMASRAFRLEQVAIDSAIVGMLCDPMEPKGGSKSTDQCGLIAFPMSLKQLGTRNEQI